MVERSWSKRLWYTTLQFFCRVVFTTVYRVRCEGREHVPASGGGIVLSNHQSFWDPMLVALACNRPMNGLSRKTLFRFAPFRWLINSVGAIAIDQEGSGLGGLKETLRRLRRQELVLIYPEGSRTFDGHLMPFKSGFAAVARRARVPVIPVAVDGAFQAWPRWRLLPRGGVIQVQFGRAIEAAEIEQLSDEELTAEAARRMDACLSAARRRRATRVSAWQRMIDQSVFRETALMRANRDS